MLLAFWSALCQFLHPHSKLDPSPVGGLRCKLCGCPYLNLVEAGRYESMFITMPRPGLEGERVEFIPEQATITKGKKSRVIEFRRTA